MSAEPQMPSISDILEQLAERVESGGAPEVVVDHSTFSSIYRQLQLASGHVHAGEDVPVGTRARPLKKAIVSGFRPVTSHQRAYNDQLLRSVTQLANLLEQSTQQNAVLEAHLNRLNASLATIDLTMDELAGRSRDLDERSRQLDERHSHLLEQLHTRMAVLESKQNLIFRQARAAVGDDGDVTALRELTRELATGHEQLYEDLENVFRGSRAAVRASFEAYLSDVESIESAAPVIDVGCGRGEWLELLRDRGIESYGVDLNKVVVERVVARQLDARHEDALVHLRTLPEASVRAITAFHLAEHLPLDVLVSFIEAALVALVPGGLLILETPNCTNLNVGASSFYLDPTHVKPLHPQFLEFLTIQRGFLDAEVRFLHAEEGDHLAESDFASSNDGTPRIQEVVDKVNWAMFGPLDYAVLARKGPVA